jgi:amino acid transporter
MADIGLSSDGPSSPPEHAILVSAGEAAGASTLRRGRLSMVEVLAQSVANAAPSAAMALLPLLVFLSAGNGTWVSFLIALVLMLCVGYCAAQFARRMTSAGSFYVWVTRGLGPGAGYMAGWGLQLGYIATGVATLLGFAIFGADLLGHLGVPAGNRWVYLALFLFDFVVPLAVAIRDMGISARTSLVLESISIGIILVLCVTIWVHHGGVLSMPELRLQGSSLSGIVVGVVLAVFAFVGFESAGSLGMEARNPYRAVGRAILLSCLIVGLFYTVVSYSQVYGFQGSGHSFAKSQAPLPDLAQIVGLGFLAPIIDLGIMCSMFACTLACINAGGRMAFAMAHDGIGAAQMAVTHRTHRTPHVALATVAVPMLLIPAVLTLVGLSPIDQTGWAGTVATFGFMLAYVLVCVAAIVFTARLGRLTPFLVAVAVVGAAVQCFVFWASWLPQSIPGGLFPPLSGVAAYLPYVFFAWLAVGLVWLLIVRARNPEAARLIGSRFEAEVAAEPVTATGE